MPTPLVHAIILNFNGKPFLLETLASVAQINYPNLKLIVVDNGSTDGSQAAVQEHYPHVLLLENGENLGFGEGNNVGMRYALQHGAEWVFLAGFIVGTITAGIYNLLVVRRVNLFGLESSMD